MKVVLLLSISVCISACNFTDRQVDYISSAQANLDSPTIIAATADVANSGTLAWKKYENRKYHFDIDYPDNWQVSVSRNADIPVINIYNKQYDNGFKLPLKTNESPGISHLSVFPKGLVQGWPKGITLRLSEAEERLPTMFHLDSLDCIAYQLNDGEVWGYYIKPARAPETGWSEDGFIFLQARVEDHMVKCFDKYGKEKSVKRCNAAGGEDRMVRYGEVNQHDMKILRYMLSTLQLDDRNRQDRAVADLVEVRNLISNDTIAAGSSIAGRVRRSWFYEGRLPFELHTANNKTLIKDVIQAGGISGNSGWINFEVNLDFEHDTTQAGYLVFKRSETSGSTELGRPYRLPVVIKGSKKPSI